MVLADCIGRANVTSTPRFQVKPFYLAAGESRRLFISRK
jgi:hypothetical protein